MGGCALITGGARRIGRALSIHLAECGYDIALHYQTSETEAIDLKKHIMSLGKRCELFQGDLTNELFLASLVDKVKERFPELNMLVNNASRFKQAVYKETNFMLFDENINLHVKAPFFLTKNFSEIVSKGLIINMLDTRISKNSSVYFAYTLSKKCLADLTKMASGELAPSIRVNAIAPGFILPPQGNKEKEYEELAVNNPMKRSGDLKDILKTIDFIIDNSYLTGQIIFVDGGKFL